MSEPKKILIFRLSSIGDIILTSALIRCVKKKFPGAEISFLVKEQFKDLVKYNPHLSNIITFNAKEGFSGLLKLRKNIKSEKFDWIIDIHNNLRSNIVKAGSGIPRKTRYHKRLVHRTILIKFKKNFYKNAAPVLTRFFEAVKGQGVEYDGLGSEVFYNKEEEMKISEIIKENNPENKKLAVICPGASYTNKQWSIEGFSKVASYLHHEKKMNVMLLGGPTDVGSCEKIISMVDFKIPNLAGKLKLLESGALLKRSDLTVTNDSGMMHMAQAQKSKVVAIFGPTTRELGYFPLPVNSEVVEIELSCRPCTHKGLNHCPKKHFNCMGLITNNMVTEKIDKLV